MAKVSFTLPNAQITFEAQEPEVIQQIVQLARELIQDSGSANGGLPAPVTSEKGSLRSSMEIVYQVLSLCGNGGVGKTAIMYRGNLSYKQLQKYLSALSAQHLIEEDPEGKYRITAQGHQLLDRIGNVLRGLGNSCEVNPSNHERCQISSTV
jgi:predicted transcriptional regulator